MKIRSARPEEFATIADLQTASWQHSYRGVLSDDLLDHRLADALRDHWAEIRLTGDDFVLVAEDDSIQGFIAVWIKEMPYVHNLHVRSDAHSRGIGRQLVQAAAERLVERGYTSMYLGVAAANQPAIRFYQRLGGSFGATKIEMLFGEPIDVVRVQWDALPHI